MNNRPVKVIQKFKQYELGEIAVSAVTVSELQYGISRSTKHSQNRQRVEDFLLPLEFLPYDELAAYSYGEIRYQLEKRGKTIGPLDLMIAAHALSRNLILVTNNSGEFNRVKNLKVENWVE